MFEHILVPVDLGEACRAAVDAAAQIAPSCGNRVTLIHVIVALDDPIDPELEAFYDRLRVRAEPLLEALAKELTEKGVAIETVTTPRKPTAEIIRYAEESSADLIVMTSHRLDPERPTEGWGTVSQKVALVSSCPVLLVK